MHIKNALLGALPLLGSALLLSGCGGSSQEQAEPPRLLTTVSVAKSAVARDMNPTVSAADLDAAVAGNTAFGIKAMEAADPAHTSNAILSPYSITQALALAAVGANGSTRTEIETAMSFSLPQERLNPALNKIELLLAAKARGGTGSTPSMNIVNTVWSQQGYALQPAFLDTIALNFGAGVRQLDFQHASEAARTNINSYIAEQTHDRITELIPGGAVDANTRVVLTNAIWFKADWATGFKDSATANEPFTAAGGTASNVPFMHRTGRMAAAQAADFDAVDLPYMGGQLSMTLILPAKGSFDAFLSGLNPARLKQVTSALQDSLVELSMPKFEINTQPDMSGALRAFGMHDAFDPARADFSNLNGARDLYVAGVFHKAYIGVDERGTEAAVATGVAFEIAAVEFFPEAPRQIKFNRPFIFLIRDRETGLILFMGKIAAL